MKIQRILLLAVLAFSLFAIAGPLEAQAAPPPYTATIGDPVTMTATAAGTQPFTYQWQKDGVDIAGATASTFRIPVVAQAHAGTYTVKISNSAGSTTASQVFIVAILPPTNGTITAEKK